MNFFRNKIKPLHIVFLALFIRVSYVVVAPPRPMSWDDAGSWDAVGWNVKSGVGFVESDGTPTSQRLPVYPLFLAFIYSILGHSHSAVKIFQCFIDAFTVYLIFLMVSKIFLSEISKISALLVAIYPPLIVYNGIIGAEIIFTMTLVLGVFLLIMAEKEDKNLYWLLAGLIFGINAMTRSNAILFPLFYVIAHLFIVGKKNLSGAFVFIIVFMMALLPWSIRNYKTYNTFTPLAAGAGGLFWASTVPDFNGMPAPEPMGGYYEEVKNKSFQEQDFLGYRVAIRNVLSQPLFYIKMVARRFFFLMSEPVGKNLVSRRFPSVGFVMSVLYVVMTLLAFWGIYRVILNGYVVITLPISAIVVYFMAVNSLIASVPRYRLPLEPFVICFAVYGAFDFFEKISTKKSSSV